ncbi:GPI mannosyltransferase 2 [Melia azedarach]|uniref:GPI mannosyltransferase 2 n=2 Tax=Melia azedarach TaxID=155640 RepID=A0ACC1YM08_MELAZ|nr:GPI mannosyltransferase 2 [Melia azedarach]KAJ4724079.1 GPI mannosyltransferase 2 [Melia azedarach]
MKTLQFPHQIQVLKSAAISRFFLLSLIVIWRALLSPYDTSASLNPDCLADRRHTQQSPNSSIGSKIENGIVWDSVYFVRIAQCGYEYEQTYAFLPLLPACIRLISRTVLAPFVGVIGNRAVLGLAGYVVCNFAFLLAAVYFYRLSVMILKDTDAALRATFLFCFNPASIFYSSIYSESLYALFSVGGLYYFMSGAFNISVLWFAISGCARSNGVLNAGYFCFQTMHWAYDALFVKKRVLLTMRILVCGALRCICIFAPFLAFQVYAYRNICLGHSPEEARPWCKARVPLPYNFIQSHYWGVGFLRYFQFKQLPNFLLASPILTLAICSIIHYVKSQPKVVYSLGFKASDEGKDSAPVFFSSGRAPESISTDMSEKVSSKMQGNQNLRQRKQINKGENPVVLPVDDQSSMKSGYLSPSVLPFIFHLGFMSATAFFVMHVQVSTRFLSASPSLYWFASYLMVWPGMGKKWGYLIWAYCAAYILLGSLLFSNFYPFT